MSSCGYNIIRDTYSNVYFLTVMMNEATNHIRRKWMRRLDRLEPKMYTSLTYFTTLPLHFCHSLKSMDTNWPKLDYEISAHKTSLSFCPSQVERHTNKKFFRSFQPTHTEEIGKRGSKIFRNKPLDILLPTLAKYNNEFVYRC